jgi:pimeloyl-ACP methyl ester carboxylesterase
MRAVPEKPTAVMKANAQIGIINISSCRRAWMALAAIMVFVALTRAAGGVARAQDFAAGAVNDTSDEALVQSLPGFENGYADVNGTRLHYVAGGEGAPLFLLPGWLQTWWEFHRMMPALAAEFRVIAVDPRGMGGSAKPMAGYDKKTMARDIFELARQLGYEKVNVAGHDIGSMVAFSFAANHPEATLKAALLDVPHPDESFAKLPMLPAHGQFGDKIDEQHPVYPWWFALNQVRGLPERLLDGRFHMLQDWIFNYLLKDANSIGPRDRAVYAAAYASPDAIRASNGWYQTFTQDIIDYNAYKEVNAPILALGATGYGWLKNALPQKATDFRLVKIQNSGHFIPEEQPEIASRLLIEFFK